MLEQQEKLTALRRVASQISTDEDLDALLNELTRSACQQGGWDLGSVMCVDLTHGYGVVLSRYESGRLPPKTQDRWELATSPSLIALQQGQPVYIRDAQHSTRFPGYRRDALARNYRTVLAVPMPSSDSEGRPMVLTVISRTVREVSDDDLTFMAAVADLGAIAVDRAHRRRAELAANAELQRILTSQRTLLREVLAGESLQALVASLGELLGAPVLVVDFSAGQVLGSSSAVPTLHDDAQWVRWLAGSGGRSLLSFAQANVQQQRNGAVMLPLDGEHRVAAHLEPLAVDNEAVGALLVIGHTAPDTLQTLLLESACFVLSVQLMRSVIRYRFETRTATELFSEIVERRFRDPEDVLNRARRLGLPLQAPVRMLVVDFANTSTQRGNLMLECSRQVSALAKQLNVAMHMVTLGSGLVCLLPEEDGRLAQQGKFGRRVTEALTRVLGHEPIVVLGEVFEGLEPMAVEWERCWRMIRVARDYGRSGLLDLPDLGALPILMGAADATDVRHFVNGTLGKLIEYDKRNAAPYLETLSAYLHAGCRSQQAADSMGLHVTTLRYRLARIQELFGLEFDTPDRRFALELALKLHQLTGSAQGGKR